MSRKDYELIAEAFRDTRPMDNASDPNLWNQWRADVNRIARALRGTNPRFDTARFVTACNRETN
jgi:hypothetical protein